MNSHAAGTSMTPIAQCGQNSPSVEHPPLSLHPHWRSAAETIVAADFTARYSRTGECRGGAVRIRMHWLASGPSPLLHCRRSSPCSATLWLLSLRAALCSADLCAAVLCSSFLHVSVSLLRPHRLRSRRWRCESLVGGSGCCGIPCADGFAVTDGSGSTSITGDLGAPRAGF